MELLAQVVEEVSILAAKKFAREKPRQVERPKWITQGAGAPAQESRSAYSRAIDRIFAFGAPKRGEAA